MSLISWFDELPHENIGLAAGGKGASLCLLKQNGFPVPDGFIVCAGAFERFMSENELWERVYSKLDAINWDNDENLEDMHAFVSVTGFDEVNLLLALMAKQAGVEDVIAKVSRESFEEIITGMGIDMALSPVDISANHVVRNIEDTSILSSYIIQGQAELLRVVVEKGMKAEGKEIGSLALPPGLSIIALQREASVILPDSKTRITEGDRLIILSLLSESFDLEGLLKTKHGFFKS